MAALSSRLLKIPSEIRTIIYKILFADKTLAVKESPQKSVILLKAWHSCLLTCRFIRLEALPYFYSATTLLVDYDSGFVVPDWAAFRGTETACPEPADWSRTHIRDWTGFPLLISSTYLSGVERAVIDCDQSTFSSFIQNLHNLPKLEYLEIRSLRLQFDGPAEDFADAGLLVSDADEVLVESGTGLFGYRNQLEEFFFKSSRFFKARIIFPAKVNGLHTVVCCELDGLLSERPREREERIFLRGGGKSKPFDTINEFNVYGSFGQLNALKSVFTDIYPYCLLSKCCFEEIKSKGLVRLTPLPEDLPDELKPFVPVCGITFAYETPNLPGPSWQELFIVVECLPLPEDMSVDCNISIVFTGQIREKLEVIIEARLLREATDIDHGDLVIVEGSYIPIRMNGTRAEVIMTSAHAWGVRSPHS
jgi:hypothetical protein